MPDAVERIVNLALFLAAARKPVCADDIRHEVEGYPSPREQDDATFKRMLERDKEQLRSAGFVIESDAAGCYRLDAAATFAAPISLSAEESALLRTIGAAFTNDPSFPFVNDLRYALAKLAGVPELPAPRASAHGAEESPGHQAEIVARLAMAVSSAKRASFEYTNYLGEHKLHSVEGYGMFAREGRWYLVGRDTVIDEIRTYVISRMTAVEINSARPKEPDFELPPDFRVAAFLRHPFQFGSDDLTAIIAFDSDQAWRAASLAGGIGNLARDADGGVTWTVYCRNRRRLLRWVIENGPGLRIVSPLDLNSELSADIAAVAAAHKDR